jgi:hypothetical protein
MNAIPDLNISDLFNQNIMSIKVADLAQSNLLQDLTAADTSAVVGGTYGRRRGYYSPAAVISAPVVSTPVVSAAPGTASGGSIANFSSGVGAFTGTSIGFGSASGSGFTAASSNASVSGANGGSASASGGGFTGGVSGIINGTFDRV